MNMREGLKSSAGDGIPIAPMIDIVFILLVFFIATDSMKDAEKELDVSLPSASTSADLNRASKEIIVNVLRDGTLIVNQDKLRMVDLAMRLRKMKPESTIMVRADAKVFHEHVVSVLDACAAANMKNVAIVTVGE